jgi:hypothetical protein
MWKARYDVATLLSCNERRNLLYPPPPSDPNQPSRPLYPSQPTQPPYWQVPPPPPPPQGRVQGTWQGLNARTTGWSTGARIAAIFGVVFVSLCLVCGLCAVGLAAIGAPTPSSNRANATSAPAGPTATSTPRPTATPSGPQPLTDAVLGGVKDSFTRTYGAPSRSWDGGGIYSYTSIGVPVIINVSSNTGLDGSLHVVTVSVTPASGVYGPGLALQTAHDICSIFLPDDAVHVADATFDDGTHDYVYQSARLATTLPARWFHDPSNQTVPAGTLHISTTPSDVAPGRVAFCKIDPGHF